MTKYKINISGSGTAKEIAKSLRDIAEGIEEASNGNHEVAELDGAEWEDETLVTTLSENGVSE